MTSRKIFTASVLAIAILTIPGIVFYTADRPLHQRTSSIAQSPSTVFLPSPAFAQIGDTASIADITAETIDSVVNISTSRTIKMQNNNPFMQDPFLRRFFGPNQQQQQQQEPEEQEQHGLGSGVIVDKSGIIITNNHVVDGAEEVIVTLHDEREFDAEIVGTDPQSDVAVIRLKDAPKDLTPIPFGDSDALRLGDVVLAIGNPFGLSHTVTMGIVSAKGRSGVRLPTTFQDFIQTDAAINPGNSGGALINLKGELVGINTAIASQTGGYMGIGFAIPSNMAKSVTDDLVAEGKVTRGWLGVTISNLDKDMADAMGLDSKKGALVNEVMEDSPAGKAGIQHGDVITKVDGQAVDSSNRLMNTIAIIEPGEKTDLTVYRDGKERTVTVKLGERPGQDQLAELAGGEEPGESSEVTGGLSIAPLSSATRSNYNIPDEVDNGVVVTNVDKGSPADKAGITPGTVIRGVGQNKTVNSVSDFTDAFNNAGEKVLLYVWQQGRHRYAVIAKND